MSEPLVVAISSTALDLPGHRGEVMAACLSLDCVPKMMEHLPAVDADAIQASLDLIDQAHVYVGIFAYRYGHVPEGQAISITEMELQRAEERGIPRLIFLIHEDHPVTGKEVETGDGAAKLRALKDRLAQQHVVGFFSSPEDLRGKVLHSLVVLRDQRQGQAAGTREAGEAASAQVDRPPPSIENNPYRSLAAFQEEDAALYFGREALIRETLATFYGLTDPRGGAELRLLAILGPSGSGKSSFARAGLAARLNQNASDRQTGLRVVTFFAGENPMASLAERLRKACGGAIAPGPRAKDAVAPIDVTNELPSPLTPLPPGCPARLVLLVDRSVRGSLFPVPGSE